MKELFLNRRFFMFLWGGVFALLLTFVFPRVYPWVIWALGCGGGLVVVDITLLYGFGKACGAQRIVGDKFSNGEENPVRIHLWRHQAGRPGRHRKGFPDESGDKSLPGPDRYRRPGDHTDRSRYVCLLFGQLQLCGIQPESCPDPQNRPEERLHIHPSDHRGNRG